MINRKVQKTLFRSSPPEVILRKCSENRQEIYRRTPVPKCDINKVAKLQSNLIEIALWHGWSPVNLMHIFRTPFLKNISGGMFLSFDTWYYIAICATLCVRLLSKSKAINIFPKYILKSKAHDQSVQVTKKFFCRMIVDNYLCNICVSLWWRWKHEEVRY